jgi:hypothetical protein
VELDRLVLAWMVVVVMVGRRFVAGRACTSSGSLQGASSVAVDDTLEPAVTGAIWPIRGDLLE